MGRLKIVTEKRGTKKGMARRTRQWRWEKTCMTGHTRRSINRGRSSGLNRRETESMRITKVRVRERRCMGREDLERT